MGFALLLVFGAFLPQIGIWAERNLLSPELLMKKTLASAMQEIGSDVLPGVGASQSGANYEIRITVDESLQQLLSSEETEGDIWLSALNLQIQTANKDDLSRTKLTLRLEQDSVFSLDMIRSESKVWLGVPELQKIYLEYGNEDLNWEKIPDLQAKLPSMSSLQAYGTILFGAAQRVTRQSTSLQIGDVRQKALQLRAEIPQEKARQVLSELALQLEQDRSAGQWLGQDLYESVLRSVQELAKSIDSDLYLITYLNDSNKLIGLRLTDEQENVLFYGAKAVADSQFASVLSVGAMQLKGYGSCSGEKETGEYTLYMQEKKAMSCTVKDFSLTKKGFNGSVSIPLSTAADLPFGSLLDTEQYLEICQETVSGKETLLLRYVVEDTPLIGLRIIAGNGESFSVAEPETVVSASNRENIDQWLQSLDWNTMANKLDKAGVPLGWIASLLP